MSSTIPIKIAIGDLTPLEVSAPTASRSSIVRALLVATVAKGAPLDVPAFDPPRASAWTSVAVDTATEVLIAKAFQINDAKNISAIIYNAVRDTLVLDRARDFLSLSAAAKRKRVDDVLLAATGSTVSSEDRAEEEADQAQKSHLVRFVVDELEQASKALEAATSRHTAAKMAFEALQGLLGSDTATPTV